MQRLSTPILSAQIFLLACANSSSLLADSVVLKSAIRLAPGITTVRLADIATLEGPHAQAMAEVKIADAPASPVEIRLETVREALLASQANFAKLDLSGRVCIVRPGATAVTQAAEAPAVEPSGPTRHERALPTRSIIDPTSVCQDPTPIGVCAQLFIARLGSRELPLRLECSPDDLAKFAPRDGNSVDVLPRNELEDEVVTFELVFRKGGQVLAREHARVAPKLLTEVGVTVFPIARGTQITQDEIKSESRWLSPKMSAAALSWNAAAGRIARVSLAAGATLTAAQVKDELVIHKQDKVRVRREVGLIAIELDAVALEEGAIGDTISLRTVSKSIRGAKSTKPSEFVAEITGPGTATLRSAPSPSKETAIVMQGVHP